MRVLVCGGRDYADYECVQEVLDSEPRITSIIQGGARGADTLARWWANARGVQCIQVDANWTLHGKAAGPIRNAQMLTLKPDRVIAFPGGRGTANMIMQARNAGVEVLICR